MLQDSQQPLGVVPAGSTLEYDVTLHSFVKVGGWVPHCLFVCLACFSPRASFCCLPLAAAAAAPQTCCRYLGGGGYSRAVGQYDKALQCVE